MNDYKFKFITIAGLGAAIILSSVNIDFELSRSCIFKKQPDMHSEVFPHGSPLNFSTNFLAAPTGSTISFQAI